MIEAAAEKKAATYITGTIETRPDTAEQGEPIIAPEVSAQIDIEEQIAREPVVHVVSFSGGRTSAYLVHLMEQKRKSENLDVRYVFMDTGAEHPKTYEFIRKVVNHYGIDLVCLRAKVDPKKGVGISYQIINLDDCKHDLQPWKDVLAKYGTPYIHGAFCTRSMKTDPIEKFIAAELNNVKVHQWLGIRVDEPKRLREKDGFSYLASISDFEKEDVLKFWQEMPFNLDIPEWLGNCVFCIKKGVNKIALAAKQEPELVQEFMSALESNDVKNVERKHGKLIMYRGHNSLTSIIETHINHTEQDLIQAMRGKTDSGSCSESCEAFACDENQNLPPVNAIWPIEVLNIAKEVFALCGIEKPTEIQFQELCEEANRQRLEGHSPDSIIDDLVMNMPKDIKSCAA
ncbi:phosphoadenosine phosphosulfate reductase family protein [Shewanella baltica]|nr:phosphoadenosine phosphosulfate reductase family protein [Shewanella baltica]